MIVLLTAAAALLAAALWLPSLADALHLARWALRGRARPESTDQAPRLLFLVPAHDERLLIGHCLTSLLAQDYPPELRHVVVVADNCTDDTAQVAAAYGVEVLERRDATLRGKPFAIAWALERCDLVGHDAIVIVDADTEVATDFARGLASRAPLHAKAVQPFNDVQNRTDTALTRMAAVQSMVLHGLAFTLKDRSGVAVPLSAGMCVGSDVIRTHGWPAFSVGEDFELYVILALRGVPVEHTTRARIFAQEARDLRQGAAQRKRWMAGKIHVVRAHLWELLTVRGIPLVQRLDLAAEMCVSGFGPVLHLALVLVGSAVLGLTQPPGWAFLIAALVGSMFRLVLTTLLAILRDPEPTRAFLAFLSLPAYAFRRLGSTFGSLSASARASWVRTGRHAR